MNAKAKTENDQLKKFLISNTGCWEFTGCKDKDGYGVFGFKQKRAHRVSYEFHIGPIPAGIFVCHKCDNPSCINPSHLFLGTPKDNMTDKVLKGRASSMVGEKNPMSKLTDDQRQEMRVLREQGQTYIEIASKYSIAYQTVGKILKGKSYGISK